MIDDLKFTSSVFDETMYGIKELLKLIIRQPHG